MQVTATNSLPLSTQIIQKAGQAVQAPGAPISPEQVNSAVDRASDRVNEAQASREQTQTDRRTYATQIYSANSQQQQIDTYLAVASEGEIDDTSGSTLLTAQELRDIAKNNDSPKLDENPGRQRPPVASQLPQLDISA
jgi:hypothetical protein